MAPDPASPTPPARLVPALLAAALLLPGAAGAEVLDAGENGFTVRHLVQVTAPPAAVWAALTGEIGAWWSSDHTYSGDAANLSLEPRPQGCFCERLEDGGGIAHATVVYAGPPWILRLQGGLGPLQQKAAVGSLTFALSTGALSTGEEQPQPTRVELTYQVGGYLPDGFAEWAPPVDQVLGEQLVRLGRYVETGSPEPAPDPAADGPG